MDLHAVMAFPPFSSPTSIIVRSRQTDEKHKEDSRLYKDVGFFCVLISQHYPSGIMIF